MKRFVVRLLCNAVALAIATWLLHGITLAGHSTTDRVVTLLVVAAIFGIVNAVLKPILHFLTFPVLILTLGLLTFVINAFLLWLTSWIAGQLDVAFHVDGFWSALLGSLIISIVSFALGIFIRDERR